MSTTRNPALDTIKGLGIVLMVAGHTGCPFKSLIYLFHVPVFFMASGFTFSPRRTESLKGLAQLVLRRAKGLYLPYVGFCTASILLWNAFLAHGIYSSDPSFLKIPEGNGFGLLEPLSGSEIRQRIVDALLFHTDAGQVAGALWFLRSLFFTTLLFSLVDCLAKGRWRTAIHAAVALSLLGYALHLKAIGDFLHGLDISLACYAFFLLGNLLRHGTVQRLTAAHRLPIAVLAAIALAVLDSHGRIEVSQRIYTSIPFFLGAPVAGWFLLSAIAHSVGPAARNALRTVGQNTVAILALHFLAFKAITALRIRLSSLPSCTLAAFPTYDASSSWWIAYAACGVAIPLAASLLFKAALTRLGGFVRSRTATRSEASNGA